LNGKIDPKVFDGKIVLIGEYGTLIHDSYFSPLDSTKSMPGIEFHANMLDSLVQGKYLAPLSNTFIRVSILIFTLLLVISFYFFSTQVAVVILCLYSIGIIVGGRILLQYGIFVSIFPFFLLGSITFLVSYVYKFFITNKDRRYIEHAFSHYIAPEVVHRITEDPESFRLGGEKREITIFFSDIASFTTISEKLGTERIFSLLEEYLSEMTDILIQNKGTLDKYIGDAVMGFFNAPLTIERPEYWACKTALEQQQKITELNKKWVLEGIPNITARIGIDTGEVMVGNIGSRNRFNYTIIGDHVNLASRLEGVNKEYLTKICVSESTYQKTKEDFIFRELDTIKVKGKTKGVKIYELVGFASDSLDREIYRTYEKALALYYKGEYKKAYDLFTTNTPDPTS
jgi:adenylate cyclase